MLLFLKSSIPIGMAIKLNLGDLMEERMKEEMEGQLGIMSWKFFPVTIGVIAMRGGGDEGVDIEEGEGGR